VSAGGITPPADAFLPGDDHLGSSITELQGHPSAACHLK
jgi:hypothetical protein